MRRPLRTLGALALALVLALLTGAPALGTEASEPRPGAPAQAPTTEREALAPPAVQPRHPLVGIGEQQHFVFEDPRFQALGIHYMRLSIGWDALESPAQTRALALWLREARTDGVRPLIAFEHSWRVGRHRWLPSPAQLGRQFRTLHARYPWVTDYATWNEANYCGEPTCHSPGLVAAYYAQMRRACPSCHVLAAELLDVPGMVGWAAAERRALGHEPALWGLHDYIGANRLSTASTVALLRGTTGQVWLTETGGVIARHNRSAHDFPESPAHAAAVTRFVFDRLARLSPRVARVYLYQWYASPRARTPWDSGLIGPHGTPRPAFWVLVQELHALDQLPATPPARALLARAGS